MAVGTMKGMKWGKGGVACGGKALLMGQEHKEQGGTECESQTMI